MNKDTGILCSNGQPVLVGDRFEVKEHPNECCNHNIICEVLENNECLCGYGLHDVKTGKLIANASIASYRVEK